MNKSQRALADQWYLIFAAIFIASLVTCNLIFLKFFIWEPFEGFSFKLSVGLLPYPITFLVTDLISEIWGKKRANRVVMAGLVASVFVVVFVYIADLVPVAEGISVLNKAEFHKSFGLTQYGVAASMAAYLTAQFVDIRIYHFWKRLTKGKHLWLRNNASTFFSQFIDTFIVLGILCSLSKISWEVFPDLLLQGFLFKIMFAALDTPLLYASAWAFRKKFNLKAGEELSY